MSQAAFDPSDGGPELLTGWETCLWALSHPKLVSDPHLIGAEPRPTNNLLMMEGAPHRRLRRLVAPYFAPQRVEPLAPRLEERSRAFVRDVRARRGADLVADLAEPLVLEAIFTAMEVPARHRAKLGPLARDMLGWLEPDLSSDERRRVNAAALRATALFTRDGLDGTATGLHGDLEAAAQDGTIPEKLARSTPVVALHGGYENPLNYLGCMIAWAVSDPERFAAMTQSAPGAVCEEILRVFSPVRRLWRWSSSDDVANDTVSVRAGRMVWIDLESAHHDRQRFTSDEVEALQEQQRHLGFGYGRHGCPGSALARLEARVLLKALLTVPVAELAEFSVEWRKGVVAQGPARIVRDRATAA